MADFSLYLALRNLATIVGLVVLAWLFLRILKILWSSFRAFFVAPLGISRANLHKYGMWAVVTGASEGIGRGYALELARKGLNVVLMSRSREKLDKVAKEIGEKFGRETLVVPVDFSGGLEIYTDIANQISHLDVGVLINNVGMTTDVDFLSNILPERLFQVVAVNCQAAVQMSHMILPQMLARGGGYIVNLSSVLSIFSPPYLGLYSATKIYMNYFSDGLRKEYGHRGIVVQCVCPHFVSTAMTRHKDTNYYVPTPESYARSAVATIGIQDTTFGCWPHTLLGHKMLLKPTFWLDYNMSANKKQMDSLKEKPKQT